MTPAEIYNTDLSPLSDKSFAERSRRLTAAFMAGHHLAENLRYSLAHTRDDAALRYQLTMALVRYEQEANAK